MKLAGRLCVRQIVTEPIICHSYPPECSHDDINRKRSHFICKREERTSLPYPACQGLDAHSWCWGKSVRSGWEATKGEGRDTVNASGRKGLQVKCRQVPGDPSKMLLLRARRLVWPESLCTWPKCKQDLPCYDMHLFCNVLCVFMIEMQEAPWTVHELESWDSAD